MAGCQLNKLFASTNEKRVWHNDESADTILNHGREICLKFIFSAGGQHV